MSEEINVDEILEEASKIKSKAQLEKLGLTYGIDLNKQKSLKNMLKDLKSFLENKN